MSLHPMKSMPPETTEYRFCGLFSNKTLCLGIVLLVLIPGLIKLGLGLSRSAEESPDRDPGNVAFLGSEATKRPPAPRPFRSQRRVLEANPMDTVTSAAPTASASSGKDLEALRRLQEAIATGKAREQQTAAALKRFIATGSMTELRTLDRRDVEALAEHLTAEMSREELASVVEHSLGLPSDQLLGQEDPKATLVRIYDALAGHHLTEVRPATLLVTDQTQADGRITGQTHVLPAGSQKVYAVFENDRALQGLDQVLAVWRNPQDDRMVFTEFEPIRRGAAYNYVWLEVASGWPAGRYQVELFHPEAQSLLLASESFSVR